MTKSEASQTLIYLQVFPGHVDGEVDGKKVCFSTDLRQLHFHMSDSQTVAFSHVSCFSVFVLLLCQGQDMMQRYIGIRHQARQHGATELSMSVVSVNATCFC